MLAVLIGVARTQDQQMKWLVIAGIATLLLGLVTSPFFAALLPFGWNGHVAAIIMGTDRLEMADLGKANRVALTACREAAAKTQKEQRCSVIMPVPGARRGAFFPGSGLGSLDAGEARVFLRRQRQHKVRHGCALIGVDMKKPLQLLIPAYNDRCGVTAKLNLNLLRRMNRELGARQWQRFVISALKRARRSTPRVRANTTCPFSRSWRGTGPIPRPRSQNSGSRRRQKAEWDSEPCWPNQYAARSIYIGKHPRQGISTPSTTSTMTMPSATILSPANGFTVDATYRHCAAITPGNLPVSTSGG
jgi:Histidine-specific methyltransferase, SAM-dependent